MTPSPTPTPKSRLAKFLLQQWGVAGSNVQVLCDNYGRVLTHYVENGDYREAAVWVPGSGRYDMETAGDTELANLIDQVGYNDALTEIINDGNVTINDNGETETLIWDATINDWTVDVDLFSNGVPTMFYVPVTVDNTVIRVLCDADGKAVRVPEWGEFGATIFRIEGEGAEMDLDTIKSTASEYTTIINALGGYVDITNLSGGEDVELLVKDGFILYMNTVNDNVTPTVTAWAYPQETMFLRTIPVNDIAKTVVVDADGKPVTYEDAGSTYFLLVTFNNDGDMIVTNTHDDATLTALSTYAGGVAQVTLTSLNDFYKYTDASGYFFVVTEVGGKLVIGELKLNVGGSSITANGAVQVFIDQECRHYWDGSPASTLYARVNQEFGVDDAKTWGENLHIGTPTTANPSAQYRMYAYADLDSGVLEGPIASGSVIPVSYPGGDTVTITSPQIIFRDE